MANKAKQVGRPEKAQKRAQLSLTMSPELRNQLEHEAGSMGMTISEYVRFKVFGSGHSEKVNPLPHTEGFPATWSEYHRRSVAEMTVVLERIKMWTEQLQDEEEAEKRGVHILEYQVRTKGKFALLGNTSDERWEAFKKMNPEIIKEIEASRKKTD